MATKSCVLYMRLGEGFGKLLTDMVREKAWYDCKRADAILLLIDGLHGFDSKYAKQIIDDKKKLVTAKDNIHTDLVDDNWTPPIARIEEAKKKIEEVLLFIGFTRVAGAREPIGGTWYDQLPEEKLLTLHVEARYVKEMMNYNIWKAKDMADFLHELAMSYMIENSENFKAKIKRGKELASSAGITGKRSKKVQSEVFDQIEKDVMVKIATSDLPDEQKKRLIRIQHGQMEVWKGSVRFSLEPDTEFENDTAWVDRVGNYYGCGLGQHIAFAQILADRYFPDDEAGRKNAEALLEDKGWLKCTGKQWWFADHPLRKPTMSQIDTVERWSKKYGEPVQWNGAKRMVCEIEVLYKE